MTEKSYYKRWSKISSAIYTGVSLFSIIIIAAIFRFHEIGKLSFWNDEVFSFNSAKATLGIMLKRDLNMILFNEIGHYWLLIVPNISDGWLRVLPALFSLLTIPTLFFLSKSLGMEKKPSIALGLLTTTLYAFNAWSIQYAQEFRGYSLVVLLCALSTFSLIKAVDKSAVKSESLNLWWALYVLSSIAAVYAHFFSFFILGAQILSLGILLMGNRRIFPFKGLIFSGIAIAFFLIPLANAASMKGSGQISWISILQIKDIVIFIKEITGNQGLPLLSLYALMSILGFIYGIHAGIKRDLLVKWKFTLIACCFMLPIAAVLFISRMFAPIFVDRYLLLTMPYLLILSGIGTIGLGTIYGDARRLKYIFISIAAILFVTQIILSIRGIQTYFATHQKEDWRNAAGLLTDNCSSPTDLRVYYNFYVEPNAAYYNHNLRSQLKNWQTTSAKTSTSDEFETLFAGDYNKACLTLSHAGLPNNRAQATKIRIALHKLFPDVAVHNFYGVEVDIYRK
jgi:hypothetical protein